MRVLLIAPFFPPHRAVASLRTHSFAQTWAAAGHDVTVLTTRKRPDQVGLSLPVEGFRVAELSYRGPWLFEMLRSVRPTPTVQAPGPSSAAVPTVRPKDLFLAPFMYLKARTGVFSAVRQPDLADGWVRPAVAWARANGPWDAVASSGGPPAAHLVAQAVRQNGLAGRWVADFRDLWTDHHLYAGLFPFTLVERMRERRVLAAADALVTVSPGLARRLSARSGKPVEVVYNGYDPAGFATLPPEPAFPADGRVRLVYTGTVYEGGQDVHGICAAVAAEPAAVLVVASDRADLWAAARQTHRLGDRLDFRGSIPRPEALRLQRDASALVLLDWHDARHGVLTGKVFEYLVSAAPIWVVGGPLDSPAARLVKEANRGRALGRDVGRMRAAIRDLAAGRTGMTGEPNRAVIAGLSRDEQARRFLRLITGEVKLPGGPGRSIPASG